MHAAHPSPMMVAMDDSMIRLFPIVQAELKIRVPDQLIGRLIGKQGQCLKKIMDETSTHITISEHRNQHDLHQYQTPELFDRVITIRGGNLNSVILAEKNVQHKLRQFYEQDQNMNAGQQPQYYNTGVIVNPVETIGPYIAPGSVPGHQMVPRENAYSAAAYNALPIGVSPQTFYVQNSAAAMAANFSIPTGQYAHNVSSVPNMPTNSVHIKSRVYVPNQIVGILIGAKGQTIKSVIAESGAIISIEGDREPKKGKNGPNSQNEKDGSTSSANNQNQPSIHSQQELVKEEEAEAEVSDNLEMKSVAEVEPIAENKEDQSEKKVEEPGIGEAAIEEQKESAEGQKTPEPPKATQQEQQELNGSQHHSSGPQSLENSQFNGSKRTNQSQIGVDQRGVFIQGYDFQVYKALYWVFQKVSESQNTHFSDMVLTCEAIVPSKVIGRIIGKQGQNVKQLQCRTGAHIKVPDDINQQDKNCVEAAVRVVGNFYAVQTVQQHFGALIIEAEWRESKEYDERRSRFREGSR